MEEKQYKYYTCKYDSAFKEVFLNGDDYSLLKALLESILKVKIHEIIIKNSELSSNNVHVRRKLVDSLLYTDKGVYNIEVNTSTDEYVKPRNFSYISNAYANYVLKGDDYDKDTKFIQINFSYNLDKSNKDLCRIYKIMDDKNHSFIDNFLIYEFNMDKYMDFWYNKSNKEIEENKYLIMMNLDKEELKLLSKKDKVVTSYMDKLNTVNEDPRFQSYMSAEEDDRKILNSIKHQYFEQGIEQGIEQGVLIVAKNLLSSGIDIETVSKNTGLSVEELEKIEL